MQAKLSSNMEDYLEAIFILTERNGHVRVKDIALETDKTMPSVSGAVKNLEKQGLVCHPRYDLVALTSAGARMAGDIYDRHILIRDFLMEVLGVDKLLAERDACCIEHIISKATLDGFSRLLNETRDRTSPNSGSGS